MHSSFQAEQCARNVQSPHQPAVVAFRGNPWCAYDEAHFVPKTASDNLNMKQSA